MAIQMTFKRTDRILFCGSKWWGDPDMPADMEYPTVKVTEDGETYDYPLTFLCQINCEDLAVLDKENKLPHEGMLYFFAAIDKWHGYDSPTSNGRGEWSKGNLVVKYARTINFETFNTCMLTDEEDQSLTDPELEMTFAECDDCADVCRLLGTSEDPEMLNLLRIPSETSLELDFSADGNALNILMKESDMHYGNWKKAKALLA